MNIKEKRIASWLLVVARTKTEKKRRWTPVSGNSLFTVVLVDIINVGHFPIYKKKKDFKEKNIYLNIYIMQVMGWGKGVGSIESA